MPKVTVKGLTETVKMLEKIESNTDEIIESSLIKGGAKVTDIMRSEINQLKTSDDYQPGDSKRYPRPEDKKGLQDSLGYTPVQMKGSKFDINTGFDGYNSHITKKYPKGHANQMIANAINKGTSFLQAQPFINRTRSKARNEAVEEMQKELDKGIKKLTR